ncbi:MAG TPA: ABC transporter permease [Pyrinomonadaceae bacterium]|nr:ABC transporter permease [Pyrinomonadaceae bacterium]
MRTLLQDIRYGLRVLARTPGVTAVAVVSLALGIGANTALFSVVDEVLLKKLPVKEPERLLLFKSYSGQGFSPGGYSGNSSNDPAGRTVRTSFPYQSYVRLRERQGGAVSDVFAFGNVTLNVNVGGEAEVASGQAVSGNYYAALGVAPHAGRLLTDEDDRASAAPAAVLSHRYWQKRFGSDPEAVGRQVNLNGVPFTVVGVSPQGFNGTMQVGSSPDVTIPVTWEPQVNTERSRMAGAGAWWLRVMGRLKEGATMEQARAELDAVFRQSVVEHRTARYALAQTDAQRAAARPLADEEVPQLDADTGAQGEMNTRQGFQQPLYILLGVVGVVLLIACANVANILLARAASRQREIAVRLALGARRRRLIRQLLTESVLLSLAGGALGVLLAFWIKDGLMSVDDWGGRFMGALDPRLDLRVLAFTTALSLLTGILFGLAPAWRATKVDLTPALKDSARGSSAVTRSWLSKSLVVAQVALSLLLLVGAGLFLRTLINLKRVEMGFNAQNLLLLPVEAGLVGYKDEKLVNLYRDMSERLEALPGVRSVTFSRTTLLSHSSSSRSFYLPEALKAAPGPDGFPPPTGDVYIHQVRENFLEAMEIPLLAGRTLSGRDDARAPKVAVVNQTFARKFFNGENPVGRRLTFNPQKPDEVEIVGLARDAKYTTLRDETPPTAYLPWLQELRSMGGVVFEVRTAGEPEAATAAVRRVVHELDGRFPLNGVKTQTAQADETLARERLFAKLLSLFGLLAQALAGIGLYGVLAWSVARRTHEIGIRMALGAQRRDVLRMVLRQGMALTLAGVVVGLAAAYAVTRFTEGVLYGVTPTDPLTFASVALLLSSVALLACLVPARRATKVDPMEALRYE